MRIKNRDLILEFLGKCYENESRGATTSDISKTLQMQRTNVSKLLNELCAEGLVEKDSTNYPVIYRRTKMGKSREAQIFETLIGYDGSGRKTNSQLVEIIQKYEEFQKDATSFFA